MIDRQKLSGTALGAVALGIVDIVVLSTDLIVSLLGFILTQIDELIPIFNLLSNYVAPEVDFLSRSMIESALVVVALLAIGVQIARLFEDWRSQQT